MKRNKLLLLLVLLMAVSGAWAQDAKHLITATYREQTRSLEQPLPYATTIGELFEAVTGEHFSDLISTMSSFEMPLTGISSNNTSAVSIGELNGASTPVTVIADGKATISINFGSYAHGIFVSAISPLYANMKSGVKDAGKWTVKVGEGQAQALPIGGLKGDGSETVTLQYNGRLKVKGVKATSDAAAKPDLLSGVFSVSASKKVNFSKGNLQATYDGSNWTWAFANNQWDYIGNSAGNTKVTDASPFISENGTVDLFGWVGASSTWDGVNQYGITSSKARNVTNGYGNSATENLKKDWGAMMGTGWFTLSKDEWTYLLNTRSASNVGGTADGRYAKAKVNDVQGIILFPDTYTHPDGVTAPTGVNATGNTGWNGNSYTVVDWSKMETAGCVFLPAAGSRDGNSVSYAGTTGTYWWSTHYEGGGDAVDRAYNLYFTNNYLLPTAGSYRDMGCSVRLVQATTDAEQAPAPVPVTYTALSGGEVLHVGDIIEIPDGQEWHINNSYIMSSRNPLTVVRANLTFDQWDELTVTEAADGAYYVIKDTGGWYYCTYEGYTLPVTVTSDGIYVTYNGILWDEYPDYTFSVHDPTAQAKPAATVTTAPTGAAIVGVGKTTELVSGGVADGGTLMYAVTTTNTKPTSTAGFSDAVPMAKDINASGKVYVWYYVKGDDTHSDSEIAATAIEVPVADIVWDRTNVNDLSVSGTGEYEKEGVTLSGNAKMIEAKWYDNEDPTKAGMEFSMNASGGYTFTAPDGKAFTKIEMKPQGPGGWDGANLGTGWAYNNPTVTWTGSAASTVGLLTGANKFKNGTKISYIAFTLVDAE